MTNKEKKEAINKMKNTDPDLTIEIKFWENGMGIQTNEATPIQITMAAIALINKSMSSNDVDMMVQTLAIANKVFKNKGKKDE